MAGSEALLASQINGGGCLAPPTPKERPADALTKTLNQFFGGDNRSVYEKYNQELPKSLAYRTTTLQGMVEGMGGIIDSKSLGPPDHHSCGVIMKDGKVERLPRARINGNPSFFQTSSRAQFDYHNDPEALEQNKILNGLVNK